MNNINRDNYESFFLLYTDNELTGAEKVMVDDFVQANPDLQEELIMLQQSVLKPENILYNEKEGLFKHEAFPADIQEQLVLLLDNELTPAEVNRITIAINSKEDIKREWDILRNTKLLPDEAIVFEDKQSLYRKETGNVIAFPWKRLAIAAVLTGLGLWGVLVYVKTGVKVTSISIAKSDSVKPGNDIPSPVIKQTPVPVSPVLQQNDIAAIPVYNKSIAVNPVQPKPEKIISRKLPKNDVQAIAVTKVKDNNLPALHSENLNNISGNEIVPAYVTHQKQTNSIEDPRNSAIGKNAGSTNDANAYATTTSFTDNTDESNNRVLFMDEGKIKKTKLGGFFRKVKRVLERTTNSKTAGNNIKVANLEFSIQ